MRLSIKLFPVMFSVAFVIGLLSNYKLFAAYSGNLMYNFKTGPSVFVYIGIFLLSILAPLFIFGVVGRFSHLYSDLKMTIVSLFVASITGFFVGVYTSGVVGLHSYSFFATLGAIDSIRFDYDVFGILPSFQFIVIFASGFIGLTLGGSVELTELQEIFNEEIRFKQIPNNLGFFARTFLLALPLSFVIGFFANPQFPFVFFDLAETYAFMFALCVLAVWLVFFYIGKLADSPAKYFISLLSSFLAIWVGFSSGLCLSVTWGRILWGQPSSGFSLTSALLWAPIPSICIFFIALLALWLGFRKKVPIKTTALAYTGFH